MYGEQIQSMVTGHKKFYNSILSQAYKNGSREKLEKGSSRGWQNKRRDDELGLG